MPVLRQRWIIVAEKTILNASTVWFSDLLVILYIRKISIIQPFGADNEGH